MSLMRRKSGASVSQATRFVLDDYKKNIKEWNENGGTGILFLSAENTLAEIQKLQNEDE